MSCGTGEMLMLVVIIAIIMSASRMGQLGDAIGRFVASFKRASRGETVIDVKPEKRLPKSKDDAS
jgi:sec-independent protein translocase protein TatA